MVKCLSYCSIAMKRHCEHGNLGKMPCNWGLAGSFRDSFHYHHGREDGSRCGAGAVAETWVGIGGGVN